MPNKPHKHAEIIKAWADGAQIQYLRPKDEAEMFACIKTFWDDCPNPSWDKAIEYRVKPALKNPGDVAYEAYKTTPHFSNCFNAAAQAVIRAYIAGELDTSFLETKPKVLNQNGQVSDNRNDNE